MKQKMTAIDVRALCLLLKKKLLGLRLANVYDVSGRLYLLKLSKANRKEHLLIESGIRIHTTDFLRNKKDVPSGFSMKLRKHLRTKKLVNLTQLGIDRVIDLQFGQGENAYHILVELYASGNVILTDFEYTILSLLRSHKFDETSKIQIKEKYPFTAAAGMTIDSIYVQPEDIKRFIEGDEKPADIAQQPGVEGGDNENNNNDENQQQKSDAQPSGAAAAGGQQQDKSKQQQKPGTKLQQKQEKKAKQQSKQADKKKDQAQNMKSILTKMVPYINFPYAEHILKQMGHDANAKATIEMSEVLIEAAKRCQQLVRDLENAEDIKGYLIYQDKLVEEKKVPVLTTANAADLPAVEQQDTSQETEQDKKFKGKLLKDFGPIPLAQFQQDPTLEYESFDQCVDEYFSQLDKQREQSKFSNKEDEIWKKMSRIKDDQEKRIQGLQKEQDLSEFKAQLLQKYIYEVQAIIDILQVMQTSGISWNDIQRMVKEEKKAGNPLANLIYKMNFEKTSVTLLLDACNEEEEDSIEFSIDEKFTNFDPVVRVDVDLLISAQMNIRKYFEIKKKSYEKEVKTKTAADVAFKDAEANALKEITKHRQTQKIDKMRKVYWFEKFDWFISSENYLCISGKNAQQNEALVKKYMNKGDLFMHTDMPGAAVTIIKNPTGQIVPPITLNEAAIFELCHSKAWEGKIVTSVYWVQADQVSKTPPTGLYIPTGSFMIRGKRNTLTPSKLELGFTLMFTLNEESIANHLGERKPRLLQEEMEAQSQQQEEEMEEIDDGESDQPDQTDAQSQLSQPLSRHPSQMTTMTTKLHNNEQYAVVQVGEDKEYMEKKRQANYEKKQKLREIQGKSKDQIRADNKKKQQEKDDKEAIDNKNKASKQVRGAKKKIQKIKDKYADQDEEERQMRLEMLGAKKIKGFDQKINKKNTASGGANNGGKKGGKKGGKDEEEDAATATIVEEGTENQQQDDEEVKIEAVVDDQQQQDNQQDAQATDANLEEEKQAVEEQNAQNDDQEEQIDTSTTHKRKDTADDDGLQQVDEALANIKDDQDLDDEEDKKEIEQLMKEEDVNLVADDVDLNEIDKLTGTPKHNDMIIGIVPMCAPYSAISTYKYKVKIQPGTLKRGRAMKLIKSLFLGQANKNVFETGAIKNIPDAEMTNMLVNNCRVLAPGLTKMQNANKQSKRTKGKGGD